MSTANQELQDQVEREPDDIVLSVLAYQSKNVADIMLSKDYLIQDDEKKAQLFDDRVSKIS